MAKVRIRYMTERTGKDGVRYFWQPATGLAKQGWKLERLPNDRAAAIQRAEELNAALDAWRKGQPLPAKTPAAQVETPKFGPAPGTFADLIAKYKASRFFTAKAAKTQKGYLENIRTLEKLYHDVQVSYITPTKVQELYDALRQRTPAKANAVVTMLRIILTHGFRIGMVTANAASKPGMIGLAPSGKLWPLDAVSLMVEACDREGWHSMGTAIIINHWIGQRQGDILAMTRGAYRDGRFWVTQRKTGAKVAVPHSPWVAARVQAELQAQTDRGIEGTPKAHLLLCETTGKAWKEDHFRHVFATVRAVAASEWPSFTMADSNEVALADLDFMHLRHTAVTELAIAGCSTIQIGGITGHTIKSVETILSRYLVRTSAMAEIATDMRMANGDYANLYVSGVVKSPRHGTAQEQKV